LLPEARELAMRGRPRLLANLGRILSQPALDVSLPPPACESHPPDDAPLQVELIHHVSRPIHTLEEFNREQQHFDRAREKLLAKQRRRDPLVRLRR
jgi:hypothetical protein